MHDIGYAHTELPLYLILLVSLAISYLPTLLGFEFAHRKLQKTKWFRPATAFPNGIAIGVILFLFYDYLSLTTLLGLGGSNYVREILLLSSFILTFFIVLKVSNKWNGPHIAILWVVFLGIHSVAEGIIMGFNYLQGLNIILQPLPILSFIIHKIGEGFVGAMLISVLRSPDTSTPVQEAGDQPRKPLQTAGRLQIFLLLLTGIATFPVVLGVIIGYFDILGLGLSFLGFLITSGDLSSYLYAMSVAGVFIVVPYLTAIVQEDEQNRIRGLAVGITVGFLAMYFGALLHEI